MFSLDYLTQNFDTPVHILGRALDACGAAVAALVFFKILPVLSALAPFGWYALQAYVLLENRRRQLKKDDQSDIKTPRP